MDNNTSNKEKRQPVLTAAGVLAALAGLVLLYFGFYMLMETNMAISPDMTESEHMIARYISMAGIYLMVNGVFNVIAGFFGAVNSGAKDYTHKITKYGYIISGFSICNVILLSVLTDVIGNRFSMFTVMVPITISVMYCIGAFLNTRLVKKKYGEDLE
ncbi:MAG: hypothetical protein Q4F11_02835 [Eubacteriales bacterium]|nr:hypothetical protein [Eubacteriales bacterium]